jgi:hypothetical protein
MLTEKELAVQVYLASRQLELGQFFLSYIRARVSNYETFVRLREPITAKDLFSMTPEEQLFADFFNNEKDFVKDMDVLSLRAHREELRKIAFEARARLTAVDEEERGRKTKKGEVTGFKQNLQSDDISSEAINKVRERGKRMSKEERLIENMMKLPGMDRKTAEMMVQAGTIKATLDNKFGKTESDKPEENFPTRAVINPFARPVQESQIKEDIDENTGKPREVPVEVSINEETNAVIITKTEVVEETKKSFNPFAK